MLGFVLLISSEVQSLAIVGGTLIDGTGNTSETNVTIIIKDGRIQKVSSGDEPLELSGHEVLDASGKFIIPGLMDANVHLLLDISIETLARYEGEFDSLIIEAAQVALKNGLTTVFDTWGPREDLIIARDKINNQSVIGSRIYLAGNAIGYGGPLTKDHGSVYIKTGAISQDFIQRINAIWEVGVGPGLRWYPENKTIDMVSVYMDSGIDFIKFGINGVSHASANLFSLSPSTLSKITSLARSRGIIVQSHTATVEGIRLAVDMDVNILQHCSSSGPTPIPKAIIDEIVRRNIGCAPMARTKNRRLQLRGLGDKGNTEYFNSFGVSDTNIKEMITSDVNFLLATDSSVFGHYAKSHPLLKFYAGDYEDVLLKIGEGHFNWLKAMDEKGLSKMKILQSATINIANSYGLQDDLGTIEEGKIADLLILDSDPLISVENYRDIHLILKDGMIIDRESLPVIPKLTQIDQ